MSKKAFLNVGDTVRFTKSRVKYLKDAYSFSFEQSTYLAALTGAVVAVDNSSVDGCYYDVKWNATEEVLSSFGIDAEGSISSEQDDYVARYKTSIAPVKSKRTVRLSLDITPELNARLETLMKATEGSKSDVLRRSVALYEFVIEATKNGKVVGVAATAQQVDTVLKLV